MANAYRNKLARRKVQQLIESHEPLNPEIINKNIVAEDYNPIPIPQRDLGVGEILYP